MLTIFTVNRLPYSDHIVCLSPKGEITEQGSFSDLKDAGGYVSSFHLSRPDWTYAPGDDDTDDEATDMATTCSKDMVPVSSDRLSSETACTGKGEDDSSRQTGDIQIYLYYVKSVGWLASVIFVISMVGFVFCVSFPSKQNVLDRIFLLITNFN
jgi:hypothetical protein